MTPGWKKFAVAFVHQLFVKSNVIFIAICHYCSWYDPGFSLKIRCSIISTAKTPTTKPLPRIGLKITGNMFTMLLGRKEIIMLSMRGSPITRPLSKLNPSLESRAMINPAASCEHIMYKRILPTTTWGMAPIKAITGGRKEMPSNIMPAGMRVNLEAHLVDTITPGLKEKLTGPITPSSPERKLSIPVSDRPLVTRFDICSGFNRPPTE